MKKLSSFLNRATCEQCRAAALLAPQNEHGWSDLSALYDCGAALEINVGHILVATRAGRTALCIMPRGEVDK